MVKNEIDTPQKLILNKIMRIKNKKLVCIIIFVFWMSGFFFGNFLDNSHFIKRINPFTILFGSTSVDIDKTFIITKNETAVDFKIINTGDKDIEYLYVNYNFCGYGDQTAKLKEDILRIGDRQYFTINTKQLNTSCSPAAIPATFDIFFDDNKQCYVNFTSPISKTCGFCPIDFWVYGNGKEILSKKIFYPYTEINVSTLELLIKFNALNISLTLNQTNYPDYKPFNLLDCMIISPFTNMSKLHELSPFNVWIFDPYTYCLQGTDPQWCSNYMTKHMRG